MSPISLPVLVKAMPRGLPQVCSWYCSSHFPPILATGWAVRATVSILTIRPEMRPV